MREKSDTFTVAASFDGSAYGEEYLSVQQLDLVTKLPQVENSWQFVEHQGRHGWIPEEFLFETRNRCKLRSPFSIYVQGTEAVMTKDKGDEQWLTVYVAEGKVKWPRKDVLPFP